MAEPTTHSNILKTLDERVPTRFYWQLTLLATLGGFLFGYDTANIGSALNFVPYHLKGLALGYLVSGASLGAAAGAILGGPAADRFGRKKLLIIDAGIYAVGSILSAVTWTSSSPRSPSASAGPAGRCRARSSPPPSAARRPRSAR